MSRRFPRCDKIKKPLLRATALEPKDCLCLSEKPKEESSIETVQTNASIDKRHEKLLTPKASIQIFEKPEVQDIEIEIFLERFLSLFGRIMKKLELAAALSVLLADPEITKILTAAELKIVKNAFEEKNNSSDKCQSLHSESLSSSEKSFDDNVKSSESTCTVGISAKKVYEALEILNNYTAIREKIKSSRKDIAPQCHLFLEHMKYFIEHCVTRIRLTPIEEKMREAHYRKLWQDNRQAQQDIAALMKFLEEQRSNHYNLMKIIDSQYQKDFINVEKMNRKCVEDIKFAINRSERKQIIEYKSSEIRQNDLKQYLAITKNKLENLRETNLRLEQDIRSKRFKTTSQLMALIGKFDADIGERYKILKELTDDFEADRMRKEKLQEEMSNQLVIYDNFVEEREQIILAIFREKYDNFVKTRAAKIIQRWWRPIFKRLKLKTKKKKKSKKKKTK